MASQADRLERLFRRGGGARWNVPRAALDAAVERGIARAFPDARPGERALDAYCDALHAADLVLACACAEGDEQAWEQFVREYRPALYRAADALDASGGAREIADGLYAELYGLTRGGEAGRTLFRYYHGQSSLATWLRAVLAQRYVDMVRARRRLEPLAEDPIAPAAAPAPPDPDRERLVEGVRAALAGAVAALAPRDRLRLRAYYVLKLTLAQIGRLTGEHEATVSRHLARTRQRLAADARASLRTAARLGTADVERAFALVCADPGDMDLDELFGGTRKEASAASFKGEGP